MDMSPIALTSTEVGSSFFVPGGGAKVNLATTICGVVFQFLIPNVYWGAPVNHFVVTTYLSGSGLSSAVTHNCQSTLAPRKARWCTSTPSMEDIPIWLPLVMSAVELSS